MDLVTQSVILLLAITSNLVAAREDLHKLFFDHYKNGRDGGIKSGVGYPNRRRTQLYSRNSGHFIQVLSRGRVVANGTDGDKYAALEIISVSFGTVRIRGLEMSLYICFDKRGRLKARKRPTPRCIFREQRDSHAYSMYKSKEFPVRFLAFGRRGIHRHKVDYKLGTKAIQFVERSRSVPIGKNHRRHTGYYSSRGKKPIVQSTFDYHKMLASKEPRWRPLFSQNNPSLNPLHNGKETKKNRKNKHKKKKQNSKESNKNLRDKGQKATKDRFPPKARLGSKEEKDSE